MAASTAIEGELPDESDDESEELLVIAASADELLWISAENASRSSTAAVNVVGFAVTSSSISRERLRSDFVGGDNRSVNNYVVSCVDV